MAIHLIFEKADGTVIKGLQDCSTPSVNSKQMVDSDLNHGVVVPGGFTVPEVVAIRTFSWQQNGDPVNPITNAGIYIDTYYQADAVYSPEPGKTFCGGANSAVFGDYNDSRGSHSPSLDLSNILSWGSTGYGVQVSLDRSKTWTTFQTGVGDSISTAIQLAATSMDIGSVNGQLEPGDRALLYLRIGVPPTFVDPNNAGVYLFNLGLIYDYTE